MLKPEQVPMDARLAAKACIGDHVDNEAIDRAIAAALNAWPGMELDEVMSEGGPSLLVLPLTENPDAE